jgi:hypothetical protein
VIIFLEGECVGRGKGRREGGGERRRGEMKK